MKYLKRVSVRRFSSMSSLMWRKSGDFATAFDVHLKRVLSIISANNYQSPLTSGVQLTAAGQPIGTQIILRCRSGFTAELTDMLFKCVKCDWRHFLLKNWQESNYCSHKSTQNNSWRSIKADGSLRLGWSQKSRLHWSWEWTESHHSDRDRCDRSFFRLLTLQI